MNRRRLLTALPLLVVAALLALLANRLDHPRVMGQIDSPLIGKPAPDIGAKSITGPYIVNFFASWCAPCLIEHPNLMALKGRGIPIIGIATRDTPENIRAMLQKRGNPFTQIIYDNGDGPGITMGITGVPESFGVDAQHIVRIRLQGPLEDEHVIRNLLTQLGVQ